VPWASEGNGADSADSEGIAADGRLFRSHPSSVVPWKLLLAAPPWKLSLAAPLSVQRSNHKAAMLLQQKSECSHSA
jgi:hypothetical protein